MSGLQKREESAFLKDLEIKKDILEDNTANDHTYVSNCYEYFCEIQYDHAPVITRWGLSNAFSFLIYNAKTALEIMVKQNRGSRDEKNLEKVLERMDNCIEHVYGHEKVYDHIGNEYVRKFY